MHSLYFLVCILQDDVRTTGYVRARPSISMQGKWRTSDILTGHWDHAQVFEVGVRLPIWGIWTV